MRAKRKTGNLRRWMWALPLVCALLFSGCREEVRTYSFSLDSLPAYSGEAWVELDGNVPAFAETDKTTEAFETYSELDSLNRCGTAYANVCPELMPTEERGTIGQVKPSGWQTVKYDFVDGKYLYNRCHLIGYQLAGENANERNLITGTRYLNIKGMLPFENQVDDYVEETGNHVLYRATPVFEGDNLVASGVQLEGWSVEDGGEGVCFNVYCYNVQPGVEIDYATGDSWESGSANPAEGKDSADAVNPPKDSASGNDSADGGSDANAGSEVTYVLNTASRKFHLPDCSGAASMSEENRREFTGTRDEVIALGYQPCGTCKP